MNFLDDELGMKLCSEITRIAPLKATMANEMELICEVLSTEFKLKMRGDYYTAVVHLIAPSSYDLILGVQWLISP